MGKTFRRDNDDWKNRRHSGRGKKSHKHLNQKGADSYYENEETFQRFKRKRKDVDLGGTPGKNPGRN
jgi:hypothetical protein